MQSFTYEMPVKVYFGENEVQNHLTEELSHYGAHIMLAYGRRSSPIDASGN